ncbi:hypothetical protein DFP72DRAFT_871472 [Ephemerocybe angulata]|uniref:Uncharacterized protein n=1 Tax=Ephemerocybe angulata TaxID=980116 RepID=A0A8H6IH63_9AGAR|nr:hypothetical protein DFP72DRAFT_871472 [Tulosesus angulatus]
MTEGLSTEEQRIFEAELNRSVQKVHTFTRPSTSTRKDKPQKKYGPRKSSTTSSMSIDSAPSSQKVKSEARPQNLTSAPAQASQPSPPISSTPNSTSAPVTSHPDSTQEAASPASSTSSVEFVSTARDSSNNTFVAGPSSSSNHPQSITPIPPSFTSAEKGKGRATEPNQFGTQPPLGTDVRNSSSSPKLSQEQGSGSPSSSENGRNATSNPSGSSQAVHPTVPTTKPVINSTNATSFRSTRHGGATVEDEVDEQNMKPTRVSPKVVAKAPPAPKIIELPEMQIDIPTVEGASQAFDGTQHQVQQPGFNPNVQPVSSQAAQPNQLSFIQMIASGAYNWSPPTNGSIQDCGPPPPPGSAPTPFGLYFVAPRRPSDVVMGQEDEGDVDPMDLENWDAMSMTPPVTPPLAPIQANPFSSFSAFSALSFPASPLPHPNPLTKAPTETSSSFTMGDSTHICLPLPPFLSNAPPATTSVSPFSFSQPAPSSNSWFPESFNWQPQQSLPLPQVQPTETFLQLPTPEATPEGVFANIELSPLQRADAFWIVADKIVAAMPPIVSTSTLVAEPDPVFDESAFLSPSCSDSWWKAAISEEERQRERESYFIPTANSRRIDRAPQPYISSAERRKNAVRRVHGEVVEVKVRAGRKRGREEVDELEQVEIRGNQVRIDFLNRKLQVRLQALIARSVCVCPFRTLKTKERVVRSFRRQTDVVTERWDLLHLGRSGPMRRSCRERDTLLVRMCGGR